MPTTIIVRAGGLLTIYCLATRARVRALLAVIWVALGRSVGELRFAEVTVRYEAGRHAHVAADRGDLVVPAGQG